MSWWLVLLVVAGVLVGAMVWFPLFKFTVFVAEEGGLAVVLYAVVVLGVAAVPLFFGWDVGRWIPSTPPWVVIAVRALSIVIAVWLCYLASPMKVVVWRWNAQRRLSECLTPELRDAVLAVIRGRLMQTHDGRGSTAADLFGHSEGAGRVEIAIMPRRLAVISGGSWGRGEVRVVELMQVRAVVLESERVSLHRILHDDVGGPDSGIGRDVSLLTDRFVLAFMDGSSAVVTGRPPAEIDRLARTLRDRPARQ